MAGSRHTALGSGGNSRLVVEHLGYVAHVARSYRHLGVPLEDLEAEGRLGLTEAARRYDGNRGVPFLAYARWWIRKCICHRIASDLCLVRLPRHRIEHLRRIRRAERELQDGLGRRPTGEEIAARAGLPVSEVSAVILEARAEVSLEEALPERDALRVVDVVSDPSTRAPDETALLGQDAETVLGLVERLPARQREAIRLHYGLEDRWPRSFAEVGRRIGISRERARQLVRDGVGRLREMLLPGANLDPPLRSRPTRGPVPPSAPVS